MCKSSSLKPLQNSTLGVFVAEGNIVLDGEQGSGPPKKRSEVSCRDLHGTRVVIAVSLTIPSRYRAAPSRINAFHSYGSLRVVTFVPRSLWDSNGTQNWQH
jgi:hypothetical protein